MIQRVPASAPSKLRIVSLGGVDEIGKNEAVRVVTSDSLVRLGALRSGVLRTSSAEFIGELGRILERIAAAVQKNRQTVWKIENSQSALTISGIVPNEERS